MVRYPRGDRRSLGDIERVRIRTPSGSEVPCSTVATGSIDQGLASITRVDRQGAIRVQLGVDRSVTASGQVIDALKVDFLPKLASRYPDVTCYVEGDEAVYAESLGGVANGFAIIAIVMFGILTIPLKSCWKAVIVLSSIPLAGVLFATPVTPVLLLSLYLVVDDLPSVAS